MKSTPPFRRLFGYVPAFSLKLTLQRGRAMTFALAVIAAPPAIIACDRDPGVNVSGTPTFSVPETRNPIPASSIGNTSKRESVLDLFPTLTPIQLPPRPKTIIPTPMPTTISRMIATAPKNSPGETSGQSILETTTREMAAVMSFHFDMNANLTFSSDGSQFDIPIKLDGSHLTPDLSQGSISLNIGFFTLESQFITHGEITYVTDPTSGEWVLGQTPNLPFADPRYFADFESFQAANNLSDIELVGIEDIDGTAAYKLACIIDNAHPDEKFTMELWVRTEDHLIIQVALNGNFQVEKDTSGTIEFLEQLEADNASLQALLTFSAYNDTVSIEIPDASGIEYHVYTAPTILLSKSRDSGWIRYELPDEQFAISMPSTWEIIPFNSKGTPEVLDALMNKDPVLAKHINEELYLLGNAENFVFYAFDANPSLSKTDIPTINILNEADGINIGLEHFVDQRVLQIELFPNLIGKVSRSHMLNDLRSAELEYKLNIPSSETKPTKTHVFEYLFARDSGLFYVTLSTPINEYNDLIHTAKKIAESFRFIDVGSQSNKNIKKN